MKNTVFNFILALNFITAFANAATQPPSKSPLFSSESAVQLEMAADFIKIRDAAQEGVFDPEGLGGNPKYMMPMVLRDSAHPERVIKAQARGRGNSSLRASGEADFPKLRVEIEDSEDLKGTLFQGARNFRVNTHLNTTPNMENSMMGRLFGDNGPMREGLAYKLAEALGLKTPATRLVRILYTDHGSHTSFTRNALLIETDKKIAERIGGQPVTMQQMGESPTSGIDPIEGALFFLFHKMIGNEDVRLRVNEPVNVPMRYLPLINAIVLEFPNNTRTPVVYDLDLATLVTGENFYESKFTDRLKYLQGQFTTEQLKQAIAIAKAKKDLLYQTVQEAPVDKEGRQLAIQHLDWFFKHIDELGSKDD